MSHASKLYPDPDRGASLALLLVRATAGIMLAAHGFFKLADGAQGFANGLASKGWPMPHVFAWCATLSEFAGGLLLAFGLLTRPAALGVAITMVVAWTTTHLGDLPKMGQAGGTAFEYPFLLSVIGVALLIAGPGKYSLDARIWGRR